MDKAENPYLLLTPGPLSTTATVKETMLRDWCTWDDDYNDGVVQDIRKRLACLASEQHENYTAILMQGSGTFSVEAALMTMMPRCGGKLLICANGAYGERMVSIAQYLHLPHIVLRESEITPITAQSVEKAVSDNPDLTHIAIVHNETTTGMLNPLDSITSVAKRHNLQVMVDAMSSFGGIPMDMEKSGIDWLVSSANKCIQGVPGFGFVITAKSIIERCKGNARSLSLDLFDQWQTMEKGKGKWRFTSPTHVVRAFQQALNELDMEGGVAARNNRYCENQRKLVEGMRQIGFKTLLPDQLHSPIITSFYNPESPEYTFSQLYHRLKKRGFVVYPGKVSVADCFRIGTIGDVFPQDIERLVKSVEEEMFW